MISSHWMMQKSRKLNIPSHITAARSITLGDHPSSVQSKNGKHLHLLTNLLMETARWCTYWCTKTIGASQNSLHPMFNTLAYTTPCLTKASNVYREGDSYVPMADTQAVANAEAAEALAALTLRVQGSDSALKPSKPELNPESASYSSSNKTTAFNPMNTPMHTPPRTVKKQRVTGQLNRDMDIDQDEPTASVSSLTATESQRLAHLEHQMQALHSGSRTINKTEMGYMLKHVLLAMFPTQEAFSQVLFQELGLNLPPTEYINPGDQSPSQLTSPGASHANDASTATSNLDHDTKPAKHAEFEDLG